MLGGAGSRSAKASSVVGDAGGLQRLDHRVEVVAAGDPRQIAEARGGDADGAPARPAAAIDRMSGTAAAMTQPNSRRDSLALIMRGS